MNCTTVNTFRSVSAPGMLDTLVASLRVLQRVVSLVVRAVSRTFPFFELIAVRIPWMMACGVGGQPGTATSTGITFETRPRHA